MLRAAWGLAGNLGCIGRWRGAAGGQRWHNGMMAWWYTEVVQDGVICLWPYSEVEQAVCMASQQQGMVGHGLHPSAGSRQCHSFGAPGCVLGGGGTTLPQGSLLPLINGCYTEPKFPVETRVSVYPISAKNVISFVLEAVTCKN